MGTPSVTERAFSWFSQHRKLLVWLSLLVVAGVLVSWAITGVAPYLFWLWLRHFSKTLALQSGLSPNLVTGLVLVATIPFFVAVFKYARGIVRFWGKFPSLRLYSRPSGIIIVCYVALFFFARYFANRHAYYSKWCADTPEGIKVFDTYGTGRDPTYGIRLHTCTFAEIVALRRQQVAITAPHQILVRDPEHFAFFDPITGAPRVWYYKTAEGSYRLYSAPGRDSETGAPLMPIDPQTREALIDLEHQARERTAELEHKAQQRAAEASAAESVARHASYVNRYLNTSIPVRGPAKRAAVLIFENDGEELPEAEDYILSVFTRDGATPVASLFKPAFVSGGRALALFNGDWSQATQIDLPHYLSYLLLGTAHVSFSQNGALEGVRTATLDLHLRALNLNTQSVANDAMIHIAGAGFTKQRAMDNAIVHSEPQLAGFTKSALGRH